MLNKLRSAVNSAPVKILLFMVAAAFVLYGVGDVIRGRNEFVVVKFRNLKNIGLSEFYKAKKEAVMQISQSMNMEVTPELMEQINLDHQIITSLIKKRIFGAWIDASDIKVSDKIVVDYIRTVPRFFDEKNKFNMAKFKDFVSKLSVTEEEFYEDLKHSIAENLIEKIALNSVYMPKLFEGIIVEFLSQEKTVEILKVKLDEKGKLPAIQPSDDDLKKYFEENSELFKSPENRSVKYVKIEKTSITKKAPDNSESEKVFNEEIKKLEDYVAGGDNISEIAKKYNVSALSLSGTMDDFQKNPELSNFAEQIFAMKEKELSYPLDANDGKIVILFEIDSVKEGQIPSYEEAKEVIKNNYLKSSYVEANISMLKTLEKDIADKGFEASIAASGFSTYSAALSRASKGGNIPDEVSTLILNTETGKSSEVILLDNFGYIFKVTKSGVDKKQKEIITASQIPSITNHFKLSFIEGALEYFYNRNLPDIKTEILGAE